jgi:hypothetical protein
MLILSILCSLTACGGNKQSTPTGMETPQTETQTTTAQLSLEPQKIEGKQAFWEDIIKNKRYRPATNSLNLYIADCLDITVYNDERGRFSFTFSERKNSYDFNGENVKSIYRTNNDTVYLKELTNASIKGESVLYDKWSGLSIDNKEDKQAMIKFIEYANSNKLPGVALIESEMKNLKEVEYVQTVAGKDEIRVHCVTTDSTILPLAPNADALSVNEYSLYELEHNGETGTFIYLSQEFPIEVEYEENAKTSDETTETMPTSYTDIEFQWLTKPSWANNIKIDLDNKIAMLEDIKINWVLKQDLIKTPERTTTTYINMIMDPTKQALCSISMEKNGLSLKLDYIECTSAVDLLEMPFFVDENLSFAEYAEGLSDYMDGVLEDYLLQINY